MGWKLTQENEDLHRNRYHLIAAVLLVAYFGLAVSGVWEKCTTFDEIAHLTAGYSYWLTHDFRLHPENGILPQRWAALPLLLSQPAFPSLEKQVWHESHVWGIGYLFFYELGNDPDAMLFRARIMIALLGVALGILVYAWSSRLFGRMGGLISLTLFAFCPTALAHGALATSDMASALFFVLSVGALWRALQRLTVGSVLMSSLAMSGLFLSKMSAVLILPMGLLLMFVRLLDGQPLPISLGRTGLVTKPVTKCMVFVGLVALHAFVVWAAIWTAFEFRYEGFRSPEPGRDTYFKWDPELTLDRRIVAWIDHARNRRLLPEAYLHGFEFTLRFAQMRGAFLNGDYSAKGWLLFFPYCLLTKTPLPFFALLALAFAAVRARWREEDPTGRTKLAQVGRSFYSTAPLWVLLAVYWAFAITSHLNIGHRHLLPTYPCMYILAGAAAGWLRGPQAAGVDGETDGTRRTRFLQSWSHPFAALLTAAALVVYIGEALWIWPHYLAYFNLLAGGPKNGYRHLIDSSLDWGQDLPGLKKWMAREGLQDQTHTPVYISYFGTGDTAYYKIQAIPLLADEPEGKVEFPIRLTEGVYCISATGLQGVYLFSPGPWRPEYESEYQKLTEAIRRYVLSENDPAARAQALQETGLPNWGRVFFFYKHLRMGRLFAFLRQREPDDQVGYSILIYRLNDEDVNDALFGPPPFERHRR